MNLQPQTLTAAAFAPYGEVFNRLEQPGRLYTEAALGSTRPQAWPSLSMVHKPPTPPGLLQVLELERHAFSSQSFVPLEVGRWLLLVAPPAASGGPDAARAQAFIATAQQGVTYRANTWHHGLTVLDRAAHFAIFMWRDGTEGDEEFAPVPSTTPLRVHLPS